MGESVAVAKEVDAKKSSSSTRSSSNSIHRVRDEHEMQLGSLGDVIGNIRSNGGKPSVEGIATQLSGMHTAAQRAPALLALQQTHGNRYVQRVVSGIQAKLVVGQPGDVYEQEADRVADAVMRMPGDAVLNDSEGTIQTKPVAAQITPLVQRQVEEDEEEPLQTKGRTGQTPKATPDLESCINAFRGGGQPFPESTRTFFERRFGHDFRQVRVHTDAKSAESAQAVNARAYTIGDNIAFGVGQYSPGTESGNRLLAHELAHVVQQEAKTDSRNMQTTRFAPISKTHTRIARDVRDAGMPGGVFEEPQPEQPERQEETMTHEWTHALQQRRAWVPVRVPVAGLLTQAEVDEIVSSAIIDKLDEFRNIPIDVVGSIPLPPGNMGPPAPLTIRVHVQAAYFINTDSARKHYEKQRHDAGFPQIILALRNEVSLIESSGRPYSAGRAVEVGKATPEDIKKFVEKALTQGTILSYAINEKKLKTLKQLTDLDQQTLQTLIQSWVRHVGIGVDCSGFVLQAAIQARESVIGDAIVDNILNWAPGIPAAPYPTEISHSERSAASFKGGSKVQIPTDLRPGDAWVVSSGAHIRIVTRVRKFKLPNGTDVIEFTTVESSGGSKDPLPGPVARTWRTGRLSAFNPITRVGHIKSAIGGTFHRIP